MKKQGLGALCVHAGERLDSHVGGVNTPVHASSSFIYPNPEGGARYPRYMNIPTQEAPADKIAALEGAEAGLVVSSGMAAVSMTLSFELKAGPEESRSAIGRLKIFRQATSLGGVESLVSFPALLSHAKMSPEERRAVGISDKLVRLSVGVEDAGDLIADLDQAIGG